MQQKNTVNFWCRVRGIPSDADLGSVAAKGTQTVTKLNGTVEILVD
jgi:hypothetical protein